MDNIDSRTIFVSLSHGCQVVLSLYGVALAYMAITRLRKYEDASKKLAEWSETANQELYKTRTTQASGAIATTVSLALSLLLLLFQSSLPSSLAYSIGPFMLVAILFARGHIKNYWTPHKASSTTTNTSSDGTKTTTTKQKDVGVKVPALPNLEGYREAQEKTEELLECLEWLEYSWLASCLVGGLVGYGSSE